MTTRRHNNSSSSSSSSNNDNTNGGMGKRIVRAMPVLSSAQEKEGEWGSPGPTRIVKNLAMYRFVIFGILLREHMHYLPHVPYSGVNETNEAWFTYDQFEFLYHWAPMMNNPIWGPTACDWIYYLGIMAGLVAMLGGIPGMRYSFEFAGSLVLCIYEFRLLAFVEMFTNHSYLFGLLAFLVVLSGGGSYFAPDFYGPGNSNDNENSSSNNKTNQQLQRMIQKSEWGAIMVRIQYAVVYFFASIWKTTPDWLDGSICKGIFMTFQEHGVNRGVPWKELYEEFGPGLFQMVALGGIALDFSMFLALALRRPDPKTTRIFSILSIMFHGFVCFSMSQRIGYTFPACCMAGSLIFQPIGEVDNDAGNEDEYALSKKDDDYHQSTENESNQKNVEKPDSNISSNSEESKEANLIRWIYRYFEGGKKARASKGQRYFALFWFAFQMAMPLRMPIISQGTFPYTSRCYRFSWTMMLHAKSAFMIHSGTMASGDQFFLPLDMINLYPECADIAPVMRSIYQPKSIFKHCDPRTIPMIAEHHGVIGVRQRALIEQFPRYVARVAGGWSDLFYSKAPEACHNKRDNAQQRIAVYGNVYSRLNNKGAFYRLFDPTVNLALAEQARKERGLWQKFKGVLLDQGPPGYEYLLTKGVGSMNPKVEEHRKVLEQKFPQALHIAFVADRTHCLSARPLSLWPGSYPMVVVALEVPEHATLRLSRRQLPEGTAPEKQWESLSAPVDSIMDLNATVSANGAMIEFSTTMDPSVSFEECGQTTEEDILFALLFMSMAY